MSPAAAVAAALLAAASGGAAAGSTAGTSTAGTAMPLVEYAARLRYETMPHAEQYRARLAATLHELERSPAPAARCSANLAAPRFADSYRDLAEARAGLGDQQGAVAAYREAIGCAPRLAPLRGDLCIELMNLGDYTQARGLGVQGLRIDSRDYTSNSCLAQIDYIEEHWAAAIPRIRFLVARADDNELATYWQVMLWLAERHAGDPVPPPQRRELAAEWPRPLLEFLRGARDEASLVTLIRRRDDELERRERLCEALFYVGESRRVAGETAAARRYFAAAVNLKVLYYTEHHLAVAELRRSQ